MEILQTEESVKLYEYDQSKPDLDEEILEHFGILGMHWGTRNGPPYPLGSNISTGKRLKKVFGGGGGSGGSGSTSRKRKKALKKARKTRAKNLKIKTYQKQTKEDIIKNKDIKAMLRNVDMFSSQEIESMLNRLNVESRLRSMVAEQERAQTSTPKKIFRGLKNAVVEGVASGGKQVTKTIAKNAVKMGTKNLAKKIDEDNKQYQELVDKLFREEKK